MMKFRRLYWVTEAVGADGTSEITGVFTSVPDLIEDGLDVHEKGPVGGRLRVSLLELDSYGKALARWDRESLSSLGSDLEPYVKSGEITRDEVSRLTEALNLKK